MNKKITFSSFFRVANKEDIDFFDVDLNSDALAFICPFLIANNRGSKILDNVNKSMVAFLVNLNQNYVLKNNRTEGLFFLSQLHEPNEYHFGYSDQNKGKAISKTKAEIIFDSLRRNRFARSGSSITNEAHNVLLLVEGIGQDNMSDTIANVCRGIFADFTEKICVQHKVPTKKYKISYYDLLIQGWTEKEYNLPEYNGKKIILVPKKIVAGKRLYSNYYNWFISRNYLSKEILDGKIKEGVNKKMIRTFSDGHKRAVIREIYKVYKKPKSGLIEFVKKFQGSLYEFLNYAKENYPELDLTNL